MLVGLIRVINPDYREPAGDTLKAKRTISRYKISTGNIFLLAIQRRNLITVYRARTKMS